MAIVTMIATAAVAAGMTAATAATVAGIAVTVATVSMYVGIAGIALKVVGAVTGNKTLSKIGTYMGYAGLIGGLAGAGVSSLAESVGDKMFELGTTQMVADQAAAYAATGAPTQAMLGSQIVADTPGQLAAAAASNAAPKIVGEAASQTIGASVMAPIHDSTVGISGMGYDDASEAVEASTSAKGAVAEVAPAAAKGGVTEAVTGSPAVAPSGPTALSPQYLSDVAKGTSGGDPRFQDQGTGIGAWWKGIDPSVKAMGGLAVGQTLAGAAGGYFTGQSAEEKLAFEKQVNTQRQDELNRRIKNASYAPRVFTGPTGLLQQGGA